MLSVRMLQIRRGEGYRCSEEIEIGRQFDDFGNTGRIEIILHRFGIVARHAFGVVMCLAGE